jgi:hypothetical protein
MTFAYTVTAHFEDEATAQAWARWQQEHHLADVIAAGARRATLVRLASPTPHLEARYLFASAEAFAAYEAAHAPRLRAESARLFPASRGVRLLRSQGEVLVELEGS